MTNVKDLISDYVVGTSRNILKECSNNSLKDIGISKIKHDKSSSETYILYDDDDELKGTLVELEKLKPLEMFNIYIDCICIFEENK